VKHVHLKINDVLQLSLVLRGSLDYEIVSGKPLSVMYLGCSYGTQTQVKTWTHSHCWFESF